MTVVVDELRKQPNKLLQLQKSEQPSERFLAAQYYFAVDKPELAYEQLGQGLQYAGIHPVDAQKIKTAADVSSPEHYRSPLLFIRLITQQVPRLALEELADTRQRAEPHATYLPRLEQREILLGDTYELGQLARSLLPHHEHQIEVNSDSHGGSYTILALSSARRAAC